ncbi:MAG: M15 family metallopeptidase [Chitinophagales bacterium]
MKKLTCLLITFILVLSLLDISDYVKVRSYAANTKTKTISSREAVERIKKNFKLSKRIRLAEAFNPVSSNQNNETWMLTLVNAENPLPDTYKSGLKKLANGLQFDERAIEQLNSMLSDARAEGLSPVVCSAYRTTEYQRKLFNNQVNKQIAKGLNRQQAEIEARKIVAYPGTSEHNLGLAADIVSLDYQQLDEKQAKTAEVKWLTEHCSEYGFILRYPEGKTDITGVIFEPWHFRYVGINAAKEIMASGQCLEEELK